MHWFGETQELDFFAQKFCILSLHEVHLVDIHSWRLLLDRYTIGKEAVAILERIKKQSTLTFYSYTRCS